MSETLIFPQKQQKVLCLLEASALIVQEKNEISHSFIYAYKTLLWSDHYVPERCARCWRHNSEGVLLSETFRQRKLGSLCAQPLILWSFRYCSLLNTRFVPLSWNLFTTTWYFFVSRFLTSVVLAPHLEVLSSHTLVHIHSYFPPKLIIDQET